MAAAYKVTLPNVSGLTRPENVDSAIVWAHSSDAAILAAYGRYPAAGLAAWEAATVLELAQEAASLEGWVFTVTIADETPIVASYTAIADDDIDQVGAALVTAIKAAKDLEGYVFTLTVPTAAGSPFIVTGEAGDTIDDIAAAMVIALNASADIDGAEWTAATQVLTIAAAGDGLGDQEITLLVEDPEEVDVTAAFEGAIVDGGMAAAVLSVVLNNTGFPHNAAYNSGTNVLTVAGATFDGLGDEAVTCTATKDFGEGSVASPEFFGAPTDEGMASAALAVTLANAPSTSYGYGK